jgi:hypothetical protein
MIQRLRQTTDEATQKKIKGELPAFTPGVQLDNKGKGATPDQKNIRYSGFMQIDIDAQDNPNMKDAGAIRDKLALLPYIALSAVSARGKGVWGLIALAEPEKFIHYSEQIRDYFKLARINIDLSKSKNPTELRYFAPDPGAILKQNYELFPLQPEHKNARPKLVIKSSLTTHIMTTLAGLLRWVTETTGYRLVDGQKHYYIFWLSYALRRNGTTEAGVYETIYTSILPQHLIKSNCISSGISHANAKGIYAPLQVENVHQSGLMQQNSKLILTTIRLIPRSPPPNIKHDYFGTDGILYIHRPGLPDIC